MQQYKVRMEQMAAQQAQLGGKWQSEGGWQEVDVAASAGGWEEVKPPAAVKQVSHILCLPLYMLTHSPGTFQISPLVPACTCLYAFWSRIRGMLCHNKGTIYFRGCGHCLQMSLLVESIPCTAGTWPNCRHGSNKQPQCRYALFCDRVHHQIWLCRSESALQRSLS